MLDRGTLVAMLAATDESIAAGARLIEEQHHRVASLRRDGQDTLEAEGVLSTLVQTQQSHERHRDRLKRELEK
jgi:hypothetical protein